MSHETDAGETDELGTQATMGEHSSDGVTIPTTTEHDDPLIGRVLKGAYRVEELIGQGGMGAVYRGVQLAVNRQVAIKVLRPAGFMQESAKAALVARFRREAVATSVLSHPNTVRLFDFGEEDDGVLFLVLELLRGMALSDVIRAEGALEPSRVALIGYQMCRSLAEAHSNGIVHRDLKPDNVFLCDFEDQADFVKVMDFGIARVVENDATQGVTQTGATVGTPAYMAPEQAMAAEIHPATDLYSLGIMLYEMLNGRVPFSGDTFMSVALRHLNEAPPPLVLQGVPESVIDGWQALLDSLLAKVPEQRPKNTKEVADALKALERISAEARIATRPDALALPEFVRNAGRGPKGKAPAAPVSAEITMAERSGIQAPPPAKKRGGIWIAAALAVAGLGVGAYFIGQSGSSPTESASAAKPSTAVPPRGAAAKGPASGASMGAPAIANKPTGAKPATPASTVAAPTLSPGATAKGVVAAGARTGEAFAKLPSPAPDKPMARLKVTSVPAGAKVFLGQSTAALCTTPCDVEVDPASGSEKVRVLAEGYAEQTLQADLTAGTTYSTGVTLKAARAVTAKKSATKASRKKKAVAKQTGTKKAATTTGASGTAGKTKNTKKKKVRIPSFSGSDPTRP